jgi:hypothetical protein
VRCGCASCSTHAGKYFFSQDLAVSATSNRFSSPEKTNEMTRDESINSLSRLGRGSLSPASSAEDLPQLANGKVLTTTTFSNPTQMLTFGVRYEWACVVEGRLSRLGLAPRDGRNPTPNPKFCRC